MGISRQHSRTIAENAYRHPPFGDDDESRPWWNFCVLARPRPIRPWRPRGRWPTIRFLDSRVRFRSSRQVFDRERNLRNRERLFAESVAEFGVHARPATSLGNKDRPASIEMDAG